MTPTKNGEIFDIAQWYPRMAVYDDLRGWDTLPYLASEFYLEYGDFDYAVTVPWDMLVAGSGELINPQEVLTATEQHRAWRKRAQSDKTVMIRTAAEISDPASRPKQDGTLTWRFHMAEHPRRRLQRQQGLHLGRGADQSAGRQDRAGAIGLSGGRRGAQRLGPLDRISEACGGEFLAPLVALSLSGGVQPGRADRRHGISRRRSSTATRTKARSCSGSPRTRSATPGFP